MHNLDAAQCERRRQPRRQQARAHRRRQLQPPQLVGDARAPPAACELRVRGREGERGDAEDACMGAAALVRGSEGWQRVMTPAGEGWGGGGQPMDTPPKACHSPSPTKGLTKCAHHSLPLSK